MKRERIWWIGGFLGAFAVGLALTLTYGWLLDPRYAPIKAAHLNNRDKEIYLVLIAAAYRNDGDLAKAQARLAELEDPNIEDTLVSLAERYIAEGRDARDVRSLVVLADAMGRRTAAMGAFLVTPTATPTATPSPIATPTARPTATQAASPTPAPTAAPAETPTLRPTAAPGTGERFTPAQSVALCDPETSGLLRVYVRDRRGRGVPGVEVVVSWPGGNDTFFTGFKPEVDPGYADFVMESGKDYRVELAGVPAEPIEVAGADASALCPRLPSGHAPSWQVVFQQGAN